MNQRTWVIIGATSVIAEQFAHLVAAEGHPLRLVGRNQDQLDIIANDIKLRYQVPCEVLVIDMTSGPEKLLEALKSADGELDLLLAQSDMTANADLTDTNIADVIQINIHSSAVYIHEYLSRQQKQHNLIYISSVAGCRGRSRNSFYGATKKAIEVYLEGLMQEAKSSQRICIARLGLIDTRQTYGMDMPFKAGSPKLCAVACLQSLRKNKRAFYFPWFWRIIMGIICSLPYFIFKKLAGK